MSDAEEWLKDWHARHAGATARVLGRGRPSSYEWLAALADPGHRVLDLACGDGLLLEKLLARGVAEAVGLDMSPGELSAAQARLGGRAQLVEGRAQALPFPDASFARVACHLALMLMDEVDVVVAEVRRVLRPGGRFAVVVGAGGESSAPQDNAWSRLVQRLSGARFTGPRIGDPRVQSEQGLRGLLGAFEDVRVERMVVDLSGPEEEIWDLFLHTYTVELMSPETLIEVERSARAAWRELLRADGTLPCVMSFWAASGRR